MDFGFVRLAPGPQTRTVQVWTRPATDHSKVHKSGAASRSERAAPELLSKRPEPVPFPLSPSTVKRSDWPGYV